MNRSSTSSFSRTSPICRFFGRRKKSLSVSSDRLHVNVYRLDFLILSILLRILKLTGGGLGRNISILTPLRGCLVSPVRVA